MTDRELLELAAKAAGLEIIRHSQEARDKAGYGDVGLYVRGKNGKFIMSSGWNPLTDDGDALRLAVRLRLHIEWRFDGRVAVSPRDYVADIYITESTREDCYAATRRAIVLAAAEIGKNISNS